MSKKKHFFGGWNWIWLLTFFFVLFPRKTWEKRKHLPALRDHCTITTTHHIVIIVPNVPFIICYFCVWRMFFFVAKGVLFEQRATENSTYASNYYYKTYLLKAFYSTSTHIFTVNETKKWKKTPSFLFHQLKCMRKTENWMKKQC